MTRGLKTDTGVGFLLTLETDMGLRVPSKSWMLMMLEFSMGWGGAEGRKDQVEAHYPPERP